MQYTKEKFHKTVGILVASFLNDTLVHGNCYACAVGNLVADGLHCKFTRTDSYRRELKWDNEMPYPGDDSRLDRVGWGGVFSTDRYGSNIFNPGKKRQSINIDNLESELAKIQIEATGYHWTDLAKIEKAFESVDKRRKDKMFKGLMAVVDVLCDIHGMNEEEKQESKALFVKA